MKETEFKQTIRVRLLALVLVAALTWYNLNPTSAPSPARSRKRKHAEPDAQSGTRKHSGRDPFSPAEHIGRQAKTLTPVPYPGEGSGDLDWPDYIAYN